MNKAKICILGGALLAFATIAQANYTYDASTGNSYFTTHSGGQTTVQGYNSNTGASWNSTTDSSGNERGMDSKGNYYNYNHNTGSYYNSNGTTCYGKGLARTCS